MTRRGMALPSALAGVLLLAGFAGAALFAARLRWAAGRSGFQALAVSALARAHPLAAAFAWDTAAAESLEVGRGRELRVQAGVTGLEVRDSVLRLSRNLYLVRSTVERHQGPGGPLAARAAGALLVARVGPAFPDSTAAVSVGSVVLGGGALVDGSDHPPITTHPDCAALSPAAAGLVLGPDAGLEQRCDSGPCLVGTPATLPDPGLTSTTFERWGPLSLQDLLGQAQELAPAEVYVPVPSTTPEGRCDPADPLNWGSPQGGACREYRSLRRLPGGSVVGGGQGQGILFGMGSLVLGGDFRFEGVVIALGPLRVRGRARVAGVVLARDSLVVEDSAGVVRGVCQVRLAERGAERVRVLQDRPWVAGP